MVLDRHSNVKWEANSGARSAFDWVGVLSEAARQWNVELLLIEDVPYGISSQAMVKPVLRVQGMLIHELLRHEGLIDRTLFVNPSTWQRHFPGVARGPKEEREMAARVAAEKFGYTPPDLIGKYLSTIPEGKKALKKHLNPLAKSMTDHIDAYLMGKWAYNHATWEVLKMNSGVQPVSV